MLFIVFILFHLNTAFADTAGLSAVHEFGPLTIDMDQYPALKKTAQASYKPWSGWWYPYKDTALFESRAGELSPIERYDNYYRYTRGGSSGAVETERTYQTQLAQDYSGFDGLCGGWALASILFAEPTSNIVKNGVTFRPVDQKALLSKVYEQVRGLKMYGNRYTRFRDDPNDILPHELLKIIDVELFGKQLPFIIDHDPDKSVWHVPVWKADIILDKKINETELTATLWLQTTESRGLKKDQNSSNDNSPIPDMVGSMNTARKYTVLLRGYWQSRTLFLVSTSEWTGASLDDHPDYVITKPTSNESIQLDLSNPNLKVDVIQEIFKNTF